MPLSHPPHQRTTTEKEKLFSLCFYNYCVRQFTRFQLCHARFARQRSKKKISDVKYAWKIQLNNVFSAQNTHSKRDDKWCFINKIMLIHEFATPFQFTQAYSVFTYRIRCDDRVNLLRILSASICYVTQFDNNRWNICE